MEYVQKAPDFPPNRTALVNKIDNPSCQIDTTGVATSPGATVVQQTGITAFACKHGTAFRINSTANTAAFTIGGDYGGLREGMQAGHTYTVSGIFYVDTALTGTENASISRQIGVGCIAPSQNGGSSFYLAQSPKAANTGGVATRVSVTFTVPSDATSVILRFAHGFPSGTCYWTDILLVEGNGIEADGTTTVPFFDGSSTSDFSYVYSWVGTAGKSASNRALNTTPQPFADFINIVDSTDANNYVAAANAAAGWTQYQLAPHCQA